NLIELDQQAGQQQNPKGNGNGKGGGSNNGNGNGKANAPGQNKGDDAGGLTAANSTGDISYRYDAIGNLTSDEKEGITNIEWTPYGKIRAVNKSDGTKLEFRYDASGNRIQKKVGESIQSYIRDASGNPMGIYEADSIIEQSIYGSSRLGIQVASSQQGYRTLGGKRYELSNHLGNVLAVVTDNIHMDADSTWAQVSSLTDYYPFGLAMDGRTYQDTTLYRYGLQGWERDDEISGLGKSYTTFFRQHDTRLGRTWSKDPKRLYPSPYVMLGNSPMNGLDPDGAWFWEKRNVRQARTFAKKTGGEFETWKGKNRQRFASVTINNTEEGTSSIDGNIVTVDQQNVTAYIFRPDQDRSDLLLSSGIGFYETMRASHRGLERLNWTFKSGEAWMQGDGEFNRNGQAPGVVKAIAGINPLISVPNAINVLKNEKDIYGVEASSNLDQILAATALVAPFNLGGNVSREVLGKSTAGKIIDGVNTAAQVINDAGILDQIKKQKSKKNND
ncbi:hypothetical protein KI659_18435, partial [Litoribacter alkaliphilus]